MPTRTHTLKVRCEGLISDKAFVIQLKIPSPTVGVGNNVTISKSEQLVSCILVKGNFRIKGEVMSSLQFLYNQPKTRFIARKQNMSPVGDLLYLLSIRLVDNTAHFDVLHDHYLDPARIRK